MDANLHEIVSRIHSSDRRIVAAITGGGSGAIIELLRVPGASRSLLEAIVPYDQRALVEFLGQEPEQACSADTAASLAIRAWERAGQILRWHGPVVGLGVTSSLVSDRAKRGDHRTHIVTVTESDVRFSSINLEKGGRDRAAEEQLVASAAVLALAKACAVAAPEIRTIAGPEDKLSESSLKRDTRLNDLLAGVVQRLSVLPDGQCVLDAAVPQAVIPGAFNPLHSAHIALAEIATEMVAGPVAFEISVLNLDKPPLDIYQLLRRLEQFAWHSRVELTRAPTFREKASLLPSATFMVGADTANRIVDPKYYGGSESEMLSALEEIADHNSRFIVAGRADTTGCFYTLDDVPVPPRYAGLFSGIPESQFRVDISSTQLRSLSQR